MNQLHNAVPILLRGVRIALQLTAGVDSEPGNGGGGESGDVRLGAVGVEHKVGEQEEEAFGGGRFGAAGAAAGGSENQPAGVDGGRCAGRDLGAQGVSKRVNPTTR